ncbi:hypothetical protein EYF80_044125 [Liparis tanakae]|uniref:Uncharacterized protein n=1 Tax=Liparis tanakae TaxID=230148 RepID=A0A4Z2FXQ1_9TELE|nr:hypothetical protein EYF80_044125 [Liparis tanakae]
MWRHGGRDKRRKREGDGSRGKCFGDLWSTYCEYTDIQTRPGTQGLSEATAASGRLVSSFPRVLLHILLSTHYRVDLPATSCQDKDSTR